MTRDAKPLGTISPRIVSISCFGFVAVVKTIESIGAGTGMKTARRKSSYRGKEPSKVDQLTFSFSESFLLEPLCLVDGGGNGS
jgi:hypothetical protein